LPLSGERKGQEFLFFREDVEIDDIDTEQKAPTRVSNVSEIETRPGRQGEEIESRGHDDDPGDVAELRHPSFDKQLRDRCEDDHHPSDECRLRGRRNLKSVRCRTRPTPSNTPRIAPFCRAGRLMERNCRKKIAPKIIEPSEKRIATNKKGETSAKPSFMITNVPPQINVVASSTNSALIRGVILSLQPPRIRQRTLPTGICPKLAHDPLSFEWPPEIVMVDVRPNTKP